MPCKQLNLRAVARLVSVGSFKARHVAGQKPCGQYRRDGTRYWDAVLCGRLGPYLDRIAVERAVVGGLSSSLCILPLLHSGGAQS
jgi:hypothetical protein